MKILISRISMDAGTQQRPIDDSVVMRYKELYEGGLIFPPVKLICDGANFYPVDGFHRVRMLQLVGKTYVEAEVKTGTLQDAIWASFAANRDHGFPRQEGTVRRILERIYQDEQWSKKTQREIAEHIGCTQQRVQQVLAQLRDTKTEAEPEPDLFPASETAPEPEETATPTTTTKTKTKDKKTKAGPQDAVGQTIPADLIPVFEEAQTIAACAATMSSLREQIKTEAETRQELWSRVNVNDAVAKLQKLSSALRLGRPYVVCVYCGGTTNRAKCSNCKGLGWLSKLQWQVVPDEMKS